MALGFFNKVVSLVLAAMLEGMLLHNIYVYLTDKTTDMQCALVQDRLLPDET